MADEDLTHFRFDFGGIKLEVSGDRDFVREMYHRVMQDVEKARNVNRVESRSSDARSTTKKSKIQDASVWVHRCSDLMRKIYMLSYREVQNTPIKNFLDIAQVKNIYIQKEIFEELLPGMESSQTLWAEFTQAGRQKIAEVTHPMSKALKDQKRQL